MYPVTDHARVGDSHLTCASKRLAICRDVITTSFSFTLLKNENPEEFEVVLKGETSLASYINKVRNVLLKIMTEIGPKEYEKKWINHEFPIAEFEKLK